MYVIILDLLFILNFFLSIEKWILNTLFLYCGKILFKHLYLYKKGVKNWIFSCIGFPMQGWSSETLIQVICVMIGPGFCVVGSPCRQAYLSLASKVMPEHLLNFKHSTHGSYYFKKVYCFEKWLKYIILFFLRKTFKHNHGFMKPQLSLLNFFMNI